jgi:hypothetical protein
MSRGPPPFRSPKLFGPIFEPNGKAVAIYAMHVLEDKANLHRCVHMYTNHTREPKVNNSFE